MIGLSGLITPSLDEMVTVAGEMQRAGIEPAAADRRRDDQPGAHRAADRPAYFGPGDPRPRRQPRGRRRLGAGRRDTQRDALIDAAPPTIMTALREVARAQRPERARDARRGARQRLRLRPDGQGAAAAAARACTSSANGRSRDLAASIDWTPFFRAWELAGNYPAILDDAVVGESARSLFADAQAMLDQIIAEKWVTPRGDGRPVALPARGRRRAGARRQRLDPRALPSPAGEEAGGPAEHVPGRLHRSGGRGLDRRVRGRDPRARAASRALQGRATTIIRDILLKALADRLAESLRRAAPRSMSATACGAMPTSISPTSS